MLMLGVQILLGFQFQAPFQPGFAASDTLEKTIYVVALFATILSCALIIAPAARHRLVDRGEPTPDLMRFTRHIAVWTSAALALAVAAALYMPARRTLGPSGGLFTVVAAIAILAALWFGPYFLRIRRSPMPATLEHATISQRIEYLLTEARVVLPGAQALLGFQLIIVFAGSFPGVSEELKIVHFLALLSTTISTALLISTAAYHRIAFDGEPNEEFHSLASKFILLATTFLAAGISLDTAVALIQSGSAQLFAWLCAGGVFVGMITLWNMWPLVARHRQTAAEIGPEG